MEIFSKASSAGAGYIPFPPFPQGSEFIETKFNSTITDQSIGPNEPVGATGIYVLIGHQDSADTPRGPDIIRTTISLLPGESYALLRPIPVTIRRLGEGEYLASFGEANIGMSGETQQEALQNLLIDILDAFELFLSEQGNLGPEPDRELKTLKRYLRHV